MLRLYNSLTRKLELFESLERGKIKMVTCGPSIYQLPHIGNYRTFVFEDVLQRYLEYLNYNVERVITITDVEDKALAEAKKQQISITDLTEGNISIFIEVLKKLRVKIPEYIQKSSTSIERSVDLIEELLKKGYAYWFTYKGRKNIYFDPLKFDQFGKLFRLDMSNWPKNKIRFHKDTYPGSRWNRGDFILWHGYVEGDKVFWDTKIGKGRPSWNIQDPAMIPKEFNFKVDLWCSGIDSTYRHHDYIIALVESITRKPLANYWIHGAHLIFNGKKMSKRKGNIKYPKDLLANHCSWNHIRFFLIYGHYRIKLNFTLKNYTKICKLLRNFREMLEKLNCYEGPDQKSSNQAKILVKKIKKIFEKNMNNDLQVKATFDSINEIISNLVRLKEKKMLSNLDSQKVLNQLRAIDYVYQVFF
ncbi:class I tRNA ligase family protein [Candidatus Bathyarchaeota archaeon]|nr:class I tRNA ligase family protein [Candidatus Bathyarchaeota archaeon]